MFSPRFYLFLILSASLISGCDKMPENVNKVLQKAGSNRNEIEKVIVHYKNTGEDEKLKAAYFLIGNMNNKFGRYGEVTKFYYPVFEKLRYMHDHNVNEDTINRIIIMAWDSIENIHGPITEDNWIYKLDHNVITADLIIENIDMSFKVWKEKPWAKHIDFDEFCNYILPYRLYDEPLQKFKKRFYDEFAWVEDSIQNKSNPIEVCLLLNNYLAKDFIFCSKLNRCPILGVNDMYKLKAGICEHRYSLVVSIMRSIGLPVSIDFTPQWNYGAGQHSWLVLMNTDNKIRPFNGGDVDVRLSENNFLVPVGEGSATKVYRLQYSEFENPFTKMSPSFVPELFQIPEIIDVTHEYGFPQTDINFELKVDPPKNIDYAFLSCFGYSDQHVIVGYSEITKNQVKFKNVGLNGVYVPVYFMQNNIIAANNPCYFSVDGNPLILSPDFSNKITVKLSRKFPPQQYLYRMKDYASSMIGAKFQASNDPGFSNPTTLYEIDSSYFSYEEKPLNIENPYRYYRYISSDTGFIRIAEINFKSSEFEDIKNKNKNFNIYGFAKGKNSENNALFENAFDGNIATNFNAAQGSWVAIDFGRPVKIDTISYLVRNDLNVIEIGDEYELLYYNFGWKVLERKRATKNYIIFKNVPDNALLLLKDLTKGRDERIFIYKNGKQEWLEN